jgi:DNA ligase-1
MINNIRPLLSCEVPLDKVKFPIYISTKFDGIRALVIDSVVYSRSLKPIRNKHVQNLFGKPEYNGFDGELVVGDIYAKDVFQKTTSGVMSEDGTPEVRFYVFDLWNMPDEDYESRQRVLQDLLLQDSTMSCVVYTTIHKCQTVEDLEFFLNHEKNVGGEGLIGRKPDGAYKYGRSTPREQLSIKFKFFQQEDFEVVGFNERMHNTNEQKRDELGYAERSSARDGLVPTNTLGSLVLKYNDTTFSCGTGFDDKLRKEIWDNKELYLGKLASIRYMSVGSKDLPRCPSFIGFRHIEDIS